MMTLTQERTENKALDVVNGSTIAQSLDQADGLVYCPQHGAVKSSNGQCELCYDEGYRDWIATKSAKELIPTWTGIETDGRTVIVAPVKDALDAVQAISRYQHSDALVLILWDRLVTALDRGRIGPHWTIPQTDDDLVTCARCGEDFRPVWGDERLCTECALAEGEGLRSR